MALKLTYETPKICFASFLHMKLYFLPSQLHSEISNLLSDDLKLLSKLKYFRKIHQNLRKLEKYSEFPSQLFGKIKICKYLIIFTAFCLLFHNTKLF